MDIFLFFSLLAVFLGPMLILKSKRFRRRCAKKLIKSTGFNQILKLGFEYKQNDDIGFYIGEYNGYNFIITLNYFDYGFRDDFSVVYYVSYNKISFDDAFAITKKYRSRLRHLILKDRFFCFFEKHAVFRFDNSPLHLGLEVIKNRLDLIIDVVQKHNL
jgi:hypothetical protein